ncbi:MAG: hypothetical protein CSA36_06465 [Draconibacterium sp.]|nr:MAG: hypothetical protein CSA36_06465 [Draconibacterium sp.]
MKKILLFILFVGIGLAGFTQETQWQSRSFTSQKDKLKQINNTKIYPNPCKIDKVTIASPDNNITEITITNIAGKEVFRKKYSLSEKKVKVGLSGIPNGIYLVRILSNESKPIVKKLIVSKN